jgi:catechol-2,3-dioxygenase
MRYSYGEDDELKRVRKDLKNAVSTLDYADLKVDTDSNVSLNLYLTDDSDNILAIVLDKVVNFVHDNLDRM